MALNRIRELVHQKITNEDIALNIHESYDIVATDSFSDDFVEPLTDVQSLQPKIKIMR